MQSTHIEKLGNIIYKAINEAVAPKKYSRFYVEEIILQDNGSARLPLKNVITELQPIKRVRATTTFDELVEKQFKAINQRIKKGDITLKKTWYNTETLCIYLYDFQELKSAKIWVGYKDNVIVSKKFMNAGIGWHCETNNDLFNELKDYYTELKNTQKVNQPTKVTKKFKVTYWPTWDRGRHDDLQHQWVHATDKNDAYYVAREEIDDLSEIISITEIR